MLRVIDLSVGAYALVAAGRVDTVKVGVTWWVETLVDVHALATVARLPETLWTSTIIVTVRAGSTVLTAVLSTLQLIRTKMWLRYRILFYYWKMAIIRNYYDYEQFFLIQITNKKHQWTDRISQSQSTTWDFPPKIRHSVNRYENNIKNTLSCAPMAFGHIIIMFLAVICIYTPSNASKMWRWLIIGTIYKLISI